MRHCAQARGLPTALRDPRLSRAGNWLARHLTQALEALVRVENWLRTPNERELRAQDREILQPLLARVGDQASVVAELVLGPDLQRREDVMNEATRQEIVQRHQAGMSVRAIAHGAGHLPWRGGPRAGARAGAARGPGRALTPAASAPAASSIRSSRS